MPEFFNGSSQSVQENKANNSAIASDKKNNKTKLVGFLMLLLLLITIPVIVLFSRNRQETRQRASGVTPTQAAGFDITQYTSCGTVPADIMLIMDKSFSMHNTLGNSSVTKLAAAQAAAKNFVDIISANTQNHVGLVSFDTTSKLSSPLGNNYSSVKTQITNLTAGGQTCAQCGAKTTDDEIHANGRANIKKVAIFLTDGIANTVIGNPNKVPQSQAESAAISEIQSGFNADGTIYFTIGLGNKDGNIETGINEAFLQQIATMTGGKYFYSPTTDDLNQIYQDIANIIGKGSIAGTVFNDANSNGTFDQGEAGLGSWTVNLKDAGNKNLIATVQSASDGTYVFPNVCDQSYTVSEVLQSGWTQTSPPDPHYYSIVIKNGKSVAGKDFGNTQSPSPTACVTPGPVKNVQIICTNCGSQ